MFLTKKIIANLLYPLPVSLEFMVVGMVLLLLTRFERAGKVFLAAGMLLLAVMSFSPVPQMMARTLEPRYLPIQSVKGVQDFRYIAVLGHSYVSDPRLPANSRLSTEALARLVEGIRLHRGIPGSRLILSGGAVFDPVSSAEGYAQVAEMLGVDRRRMILVDSPRDTAEEAKTISTIVKGEPFLLVTAAMHMPRAVALFKRQGAVPVPSPADYRTAASPAMSPSGFFPHPDYLVTARSAWHEMMGRLWSRFRGEI